MVDQIGSMAFSIFDGASVSGGRGLKLANRIPNIDLLVIGIEQVRGSISFKFGVVLHQV